MSSEKAAAAEKDLPAKPPDLHPPDPSQEDIDMENAVSQATENDADVSVVTRAQGRKRKAGNPAESRPNCQSPRLNPTSNGKEDLSPKSPPAVVQPVKTAPITSKPAASAETIGVAGVQKAIQKAQKQARKEAEIRDSMWGQIAKAVDDAMEAKASEHIGRHHIEHIVKAILECALPKLPRGEGVNQSQPENEINNDHEENRETTSDIGVPPFSTKPMSWANVAAKNSKPGVGKPTLASPLKGSRPDKKLMVRLGKNSPHQTEHSFALQKKANSALLSKTVIGKVAHINSGIALIPVPGTTIAQLKEHKETLARIFGACCAERKKKWAKYLVRGVPRCIQTLETLEDVTPEIAAEAFEQSCNMRPEWARWIVSQDGEEKELVEASMTFAVRPSNIRRIPKVISLLGEMHIIVALLARETPIQCTQCGKWSHKKDKCAKRARCFHCDSNKHSLENHRCQGEE